MIAEQLIRSGQAFMQGTGSPTTLLNMVSDSTDEKVKNYWQRVLIVEVDRNEGRVEVHPVRSWGSWHTPEGSKKQTFVPDRHFASLAPVFFPSGGNQLNAQGFYGLPIYLVWDQHWQNFAANSNGVQSFLKPRLMRTADIELSEELQELCCRKVHELINGYKVETKKTQAVLILALAEVGDPFTLSSAKDEDTCIAKSKLDTERWLCADTNMMLERVWEAKLREGAEKGEMERGTCAFTGEKGPVVSGDNKAWPWFTTTWKAPFPETFGDKDHVKQLALSPEAYKYLTVGASLFGKLTKQLNFNLNKQLFAPVDSARKREIEENKKTIDENKATILGSAIVTPLLDIANLDREDEQLFADGMEEQLKGERRGAALLLSNLLGYEGYLPEELTYRDRFRLTSLYFSGNPSRGDIHLHATIEDIVPSVLKAVDVVTSELFAWSTPFYSERQEWLHRRTQSLPYLLVTAYGPASLWQSLSAVLHADSLPWEPFVRGIAHRCAELSHDLSDNNLLLRNEAVFYATFRHFYDLYHRTFNLERRTMRPWQDLVHNIGEAPVQEIEFQDTEELGFAAGYLVRHFANQYYANSKKDYLQHRVMTFGSDIKPEVIYRRALGKLPEYAMRRKFRLNEDFTQRLGVWLSAYPRMKTEVNRRTDEFMAAFWAGYMLGRVK